MGVENSEVPQGRKPRNVLGRSARRGREDTGGRKPRGEKDPLQQLFNRVDERVAEALGPVAEAERIINTPEEKPPQEEN